MPKTNDNSIVTKGILRYFYEKLSNNLNTLLGKKVDKVDGKGLSTNDFTTAYKNKLDGIANGANKYVLPTASSNVLGGIKTGYQANGKVYALQVDGNGNGYVSVPWTNNNTTYGLATTSANGLLKMLDGSTNSFMAGDGNWKDIISVIDSRISAKILTFFPVGTIIQTENSANPSTYLGGTWQPYAQGRCLIGAGEGDDGTTSMSFTAGGEYGKYNKTLDQSEIGDTSVGIIGNYAGTYYGVHSHTGFKSFSILNPVIGVNIWRRTA